MQVFPITPNCAQNYETKNHACFGISPFNSYFSEERILQLIKWGQQEFESMHLFVPDKPSAYTLEALGYSEKEADWKARKQSRWLKNKIRRALLKSGYEEADIPNLILDWQMLSENNAYLQSYEYVLDTYKADKTFRKACLEASKWVLESKVEDTSKLSTDVLQSACRYLLTEIPLFVNTSNIIEKKASVFCYHQCVPIIENLFKGQFSVNTSQNQGFLVLDY